MTCFVLEVETVVLVKTEDEGHFCQAQVLPLDRARSHCSSFFALLAVGFAIKR